MSRKFRADDFAESLNYAVAGLVYAFRTQRHLRAHFFIAVLVVLLAIAFDLERVELALLTLTIGVVIICELVNTSVEAVVDLITEEYHPPGRHCQERGCFGSTDGSHHLARDRIPHFFSTESPSCKRGLGPGHWPPLLWSL